MLSLRTHVLLVSFLTLGSAACGKKSLECDTLVNLIDDDDQALSALDLKTKDSRKLATATRGLAGVETKLATDLGAAGFTVKDVKKVATDYQAFANEVSAAANELAKVLDRSAELEDKVDDTKPNSVTKAWLAAVQKVVTRCQARPQPACQSFATAVKSVPDKVDDMDVYGKALDRVATDLRKIQTNDVGLRSDLDNMQKQTVELAKVFLDIAELQRKAKASGAAMDLAVAKEKPLNDRVNTVCGLTAAKKKK